MQPLFLFLFFLFFSCAPQQLASFKPFLFHSITNNRRILHEPFVPLDTFPPSEPPKPSSPFPSPHSTPNPKHPLSSTTTTQTTTPITTTTTDPSPFFPNYPSSPPPPSPITFASFPANISSLILPHSPQPTSSPNKLLPVALSAAACAAVAVAISTFIYCRRRNRNRHSADENKALHSDSNLELFPRNAEPSAASPEFLYLGTVVNSRGIDDAPRGGGSMPRKMESPELRPLPPLARLPEPPPPPSPPRTDAGDSEEEDEEFYSPRGSSLGGRESSGGTESISRRVFSARNFAGRSEVSSSASCSSSSSGSPDRSHSINLSPAASLSPRRTQPMSPEITSPQNATLVSSPIRNQHVQSSCSSSSFSSPCSTPERAFGEEVDTHSPSLSPLSLSPNRALEKNPNGALNACTNPCASSSSLSSQERILEKNEDEESSPLPPPPPQPPRVSNASSESGKSISSSSAFSLPSSPEKVMHHQGFDQSPRMSSVSDGLMLPGLSSLPLSPALLSSPETERGFSIGSDVSLPQRKHWNIPLLSTTTPFGQSATVVNVFDQIEAFPVPSQRKHWEIPVIAPSRPPPPPPPPPPVQRQRKQWEMQLPDLSTPVGQPILRPPELVPPSRPFVLQKLTTDVSPVELPASLGEIEEPLKPKLKPLHWDKVRTSSDREMVWDQLKSSSFKLNEEMIETLFVVNTPNLKPKDATPSTVHLPQNQEDRVLDPKKSQNIAILLKALNVTIEEVCEALLEGSTDTLGAELLESLLKMAPSKEEERKLKEHKDDSPTKLDLAEKFLKAVLDIPFAFKRVEAMLYMVNFESEVEYLTKSFQTLEAACEELRHCRMFLKLLEAVLKTGNRMNVGTNRGDAQAFKLDTLLKLADVKGADGKTTLLHFVVQEIIRTEGARLSGTTQTPSSSLIEDAKCRRLGLQVVSNLSSELANVKKAAGMDSEVLSSEVSKLTKGIANIAEVVQLNQKAGSDESSQKFTESMNKFIRMAEEEILKIKAQESVAMSLVKEITEYFHGNLAKEEAHPFRIFMVVRDFLAVLDRVCKEVGMINERTMISSAHKFPVPVNPMLPQPLPGLHGRQQLNDSSDDDSPSP